MGLKSFIAQSGQTVQDLCSMAYGDSTLVMQLLKENPFLDINSNNYGGKKINFTPQINVDYSKMQLAKSFFATAPQVPYRNRIGYILREDGGYVLQENNNKILLEN